ncbi:hypothetical protein [Nonomuraea sp. bgisy101]|uniref:hypothetical protein n=1 Tax=Nonomuraea sp. bgisy101 TaxID=3413784 RepID=UPI003D72AA2C
MTRTDGDDSARQAAAHALQLFWENVNEYGVPMDELIEEEAEIRGQYERILRVAPGDVAGATGLTLLALGKLRAHIGDELDEEHQEDYGSPFAGLRSDEAGHALAGAVVRDARRALDLDPANALAAFALGYALEWAGDTGAALTAYRDALRIDPYDSAALARLSALEGGERAHPEAGLPLHHSSGFYTLEMTHLVGHSGSTNGWAWLLTDLTEVKEFAEEHLQAWERERGASLEEQFWLSVYRPAHPAQHVDLREAIRGARTIDWSLTPIPALTGPPLPAGQPIRLNGEVLFYGETAFTDLPMDDDW